MRALPWHVRSSQRGLAVLALVATLLAACGRGAGVGTPSAAPPIEGATFDGRTLRLSDYANRPVVINFWASWCAPCRGEMPLLERTARASEGRGVVFLGVATRDDEGAARAFLREVGVTYPNIHDGDNAIATRYKVSGLPVTVFVGRDGRIARYWFGALGDEQLATFVDEIAR